MATKSPTPLRLGIYCPPLTLFHPTNEDLDLATIAKHSVRLTRAGLVGLITLGSIPKAVHFSRSEKAAIARMTGQALDEAGYTDVPMICKAAEQRSNLFADLLNCAESNYRTAIDESRSEESFVAVADESPVPILLHNYPGAVVGIDMDSDVIIRMAQDENIVGTKLMCGNTGKLTRAARTTDTWTSKKKRSGFKASGGMADSTVQTWFSGGSGMVSEGTKVMPKIVVKGRLVNKERGTGDESSAVEVLWFWEVMREDLCEWSAK
ncbi:MAG: hypothetical protein ASARMPREDX12_005947 [Alectoria sarmentosa]|nr:MAG: hypothetical protein ASARMPREDX12_005947 [Alectoria sarmentosa]